MKGPVLVTGGAGSLGKRVTQRLRGEGYRVRVFDLPVANFTGLENDPDIEIVRGNLAEEQSIKQAVEGAGAVIHLAALLPPASERDRARTFAINTTATAKLAQALSETNPAAPLIFSSSVSTYGDTTSENKPLTVDHPQVALDIYADSKIIAEKGLLEHFPNAVILRISGISVPVVQTPPEVWPFTAEQRLEFVHRDDVVTALCEGVVTDGAKGKAFNIAGGLGWRMTGRSYVKDYYDLLGVPIEEARFQEKPGWFDWYDTGSSQRLLRYQNTSYQAYLEQLRALVKEMMG